MEQRRKQIMANQPRWGDPPSPPESRNGNRDRSHSDVTAAAATREDIAALDPLDASIMSDPKSRVRRVQKPPATFSCKRWTLEDLLRKGKKFAPVPRIRGSTTTSISEQIEKHEAARPGVPLVVERLHEHPNWIGEKFNPAWLEENGPKEITARNVHGDRKDRGIKLTDFIARSRATTPFAAPGETERLYGKDVPCPSEWNEFLHHGDVVPPDLAPNGPHNLLNNLPKLDQPETLMCYLGIGDTFTPCHKDLCASSGHNLMCYTEKGGSSFWFMTATSSANAVAEYFNKKLRQELDHENHVITVEELAKAPFEVYITEQKLGDLILVPPRSAHQVVNSGGITIKTSWSRMTLDGLYLGLRYELPLYRRVCRSETYRVKSTIYYALQVASDKVSELQRKQPASLAGSRHATASTSQEDMATHLQRLRRLVLLFDFIIVEEYSPAAALPSSTNGEDDGGIDPLTCDFCGGDVFQSFFECGSCVDDGLVICPGCYVEGRTCTCEVMTPKQCRPFDVLLKTRAQAVSKLRHGTDKHHIPTQEELLGDDKLGIFRAALVLRNVRIRTVEAQKQDELRRCTTIQDRAHSSPNPWVLACNKCHAESCFEHMVSERRLHSAEALLAHDKDESHSVFHQCHRASKKRFESELTSLKLEGLDQTPDPKIHLAYLANTFAAYKPVSDLKFIKAGFYDRHVCENEIIPTDPQMVPAKFRRIVSKAAPKPPKRYVLDCVLLPIYRPPKRKERPEEPVSLTERSQLRDEVDLAVDSPPRKKAKRTQAPKGPPGSHKATDPEPNHQRRISTNKDSHSKKAVITLESSDGSDSDEGPIKKKARGVISRPLKSIVAELRFKKNGQTAVADALNTASVQNSTSVPNSVRQSSSSSASPPLPRRHLRRRALPAPNALASSSSEGSNANAATGDVPRRHPERAAPPTAVSPFDGPVATDDPSHTIIAGLTQEISDVKQEVASLRQTTSPGETIKVMTDFVLNIIKMTYPPQPPPPAFHGRNWPISRGYRGRGRGGVSFGDHSRRVYHQEFQQDYRPARQYYVPQGQQWVPPDHGPARRMDAPQYGEERTWSWGPHADERRAPAFEEQGMRRHSYAEDREDPRAPLRQSRRSTRFSPPNSPGHGLDLVPLPPRTPLRSVGGGAPQGEGNETGSGSEATVTNTVRPWQTPVQGTSAPRPKFFATLRRSEGPPDEQDWEANYAQSEAT